MKYFLTGIMMLLIFFVVSNLGADKLYTWTDENGNLHITEKPPPENATLNNIMNYHPEPEKEALENQRRQETSVRDALREEQLQKTRQARMDAEKAKKEADKARARADEAARRAKEYIDSHDTNQYMRRAYKYELRKAAEDAKTAEDQARDAEKKAVNAEQRAILAEQRLKETGD